MALSSGEVELNSALLIVKWLLGSVGFWPLDFICFRNIRTSREKLNFVIRWILIIVTTWSVISETLFLVLVAKGDLAMIVEWGTTFVTNLLVEFIIVAICFKHDKLAKVLNAIYHFAKTDDQDTVEMIKEGGKQLKAALYILSFTIFCTISGYVFIPHIDRYLKMRANPDLNIPPPLLFHSYYPYDATVFPYYQISLSMEMIRSVAILNMIAGSDTLFVVIIVYINVQFKLLQKDLANIVDRAKDKLHDNSAEIDYNDTEVRLAINRELDILLKLYIKRHIEILRLCEYTEEAYTAVIFLHLLLHATILSLIGWEIVTNLDESEYIVCLQYVFYLITVIIQPFIYGYFGSELMYHSQAVADACYNSEWHIHGSISFKKSLIFIMKRAQKPCTITAMGFSTLSLEMFVNVMTGAGSYFAIIQSLQGDD